MLEIKQSCETPQQRKRWHVCELLPQATGMARGSTPRQELLVSKAGFSNTLHSSQKPTILQRATVQTNKKNLIPPVRNLFIIFTAQLKLG